jgi:hypothetical protein
MKTLNRRLSRSRVSRRRLNSRRLSRSRNRLDHSQKLPLINER